MTAIETRDEVDTIISKLARAVENVVAANGNGSHDSAVNELHKVTDSKRLLDNRSRQARDLEQFLKTVIDGTWSVPDPATWACSLAMQIPGHGKAVDDDNASMVDRLRGRLLTAGQVEALPAPDYLLEGYIVENSLGVLYGKPGGGKSIVLLDWAASIATGSWWFGRKVKAGPVLYVVAEGLAGMGQRVRAWKEDRRMYGLDGLHFLAGAVNLLSLPDVLALCTVAAELEPAFIAIDTLGRSMPGGDENSPKDMGVVVDHLTRLQNATSAAVWLAHHATKADGTLRGHTALEGAMDTVCECKGAEARLMLGVDKQKDDRRGSPLHLHLVEVGQSVVLRDRPDPNRAESDLSSKQSDCLRALELVADDDGVSASIWSDAAIGLGVSRSTFFEAKKALVVRGLVRKSKVGGHDRFAVVATGQEPIGDF